MAYQANKWYNVTVVSAEITKSERTDSDGITLFFNNPDEGDIDHTVWITEKTVERARDTLLLLGATEQQLQSAAMLENIGSIIGGARCSIKTVDDEYKGKVRVRVQWINKWRDESAFAGSSSHLSKLFGGVKSSAKVYANGSTTPEPPNFPDPDNF